jgi:hypothetical protein
MNDEEAAQIQRLEDALTDARDKITDLEQEVKDLKEANDKMQTALDDISYIARYAL